MLNSPAFSNLLASPMSKVDQVIRQHLSSDVPLIQQVSQHIISAGGKRVRPAVTLLAAFSLGCDDDKLYELAAMVECLHTATLLHDDVVDNSDLRRGSKTANVLFGNAPSVLVGDFLYTRAFQMMIGCQNMRILEVMADATNIIAEGEVMQLVNIGNLNIDEAEYLRVIQYKTAKLFEVAAQIGALIAKAPIQLEQALARYGMHLGTAFQLIDDVLDYSGDAANIGKLLGDDLAEGKVTLPLIFTLRNGDSAAVKIVSQALNNPDRSCFNEVLAALKSCGALDYAKTQANNAAARAIQALQILPDNKFKQALSKLALLSTERCG